MSVTNLLMKLSRDDFKLVEKEFEIARLSTEKEKFIIKVKELSDVRLSEIREATRREDGKIDSKEFTLQILLYGVVEPDFKSQELLKHFKAATPYELLELIFKAGERDEIASKILSFSGIGEEEAVKEAKN